MLTTLTQWADSRRHANIANIQNYLKGFISNIYSDIRNCQKIMISSNTKKFFDFQDWNNLHDHIVNTQNFFPLLSFFVRENII